MGESQNAGPAIFGTFVGEITAASAKALTTKICFATQNGASSLNLVLQSVGGGVAEGVFLYNFLRAQTIPLTIYYIGSVSSAAVLVYLAAPQRYATHNASFMIHRVHTTQQAVASAELAAATESLKIDDQRTDEILKSHLTLSRRQWRRYDQTYLWLTAQDDLGSGMVTNIGEFAPPIGAPIYDFALA